MINNYMNPYNPYQYNSNSNSYQNSYQQSMQTVPQTNVNWIRVNDVESTKSQMVQPNNQIWMMNTNEPIFYVKSADALGVSTLKAYRFEEIDISGESKAKISDKDLTEYVKKDELDKIIEEKIKDTLLVKESNKESSKENNKGGKVNGKSSNESNE